MLNELLKKYFDLKLIENENDLTLQIKTNPVKMTSEDIEKLKLALSEKGVAPIQNNKTWKYSYRCGACGHIALRGNAKYCPWCGTLIDWENVIDEY